MDFLLQVFLLLSLLTPPEMAIKKAPRKMREAKINFCKIVKAAICSFIAMILGIKIAPENEFTNSSSRAYSFNIPIIASITGVKSYVSVIPVSTLSQLCLTTVS